jgi:O-antigen ligase
VDFTYLLNKNEQDLLSAIPWSITLSLSTYYLLNWSINSDHLKTKIGWLLLWGYFTFHLFFINIERTGMALFLFLNVYSLFYVNPVLNKKKVGGGLLIILAALFIFSPSLKSGFKRAWGDMQAYHKGEINTSLGLRWGFMTNSLTLIKNKPFLGYGTGNFAYAYEQTGGPKLEANQLLGDPHNTYLNIAVQLGLTGLIIYLLWLASLFQLASVLPSHNKLMTYGLIMAFILTNLSVSAFLRTRICTLFLVLIAAQLGQFFNKKSDYPN